jgi:hypothetical protein
LLSPRYYINTFVTLHLLPCSLHYYLCYVTFSSLLRYIFISDTSDLRLCYITFTPCCVTFSSKLHLRFCYVTFTSLLHYILVFTTLHSHLCYVPSISLVPISATLHLHLCYVTFVSVTLHSRYCNINCVEKLCTDFRGLSTFYLTYQVRIIGH